MSLLQRITRRIGRHLRRPALDAAGRLRSDLWLDQPDAHAAIDRRRAAGEISDADAERLHGFVDHGYLTLDLGLDAAFCARLETDVERLWRERPRDVAYAYQSLLTRFADGKPEDRLPSCRIADLHTRSETAHELYLNRKIFDAVELVFGAPAIATQSLYFEWGSQQALHRDPIYVQMKCPSHLAAVWIALEDIDPSSGPLVYVPGSHRLPYYQFRPGQHLFEHGVFGQPELDAALAWDRRHWEAAELAPRVFTPRRGEALIWHHSLLHGGSALQDPARTRKSFVVHFTTLGSMRRVENGYRRFRAGEPDGLEVLRSRRLLEKDGCRGFASPLADPA